MEVKEGSEKVGVKFNIQKTKIMASGPIICGKWMGTQWKQWRTLFLGLKITADGNCSSKIKRCLLPGRKAMINLDSILKSTNITLPTRSI